MKELMKKAHKMAREIKAENPTIDYKFQLGLCLTYLHEEAKRIEKVLNDMSYLLRVTKDISKEQLEKNEMLQDSVMFRFIQISENLKKVSSELKELNNKIPWSQVIGLRNKIVHEYGRIDLTIIYDVLKKDLNKLYADLKELI